MTTAALTDAFEAIRQRRMADKIAAHGEYVRLIKHVGAGGKLSAKEATALAGAIETSERNEEMAQGDAKAYADWLNNSQILEGFDAEQERLHSVTTTHNKEVTRLEEALRLERIAARNGAALTLQRVRDRGSLKQYCAQNPRLFETDAAKALSAKGPAIDFATLNRMQSDPGDFPSHAFLPSRREV